MNSRIELTTVMNEVDVVHLSKFISRDEQHRAMNEFDVHLENSTLSVE